MMVVEISDFVRCVYCSPENLERMGEHARQAFGKSIRELEEFASDLLAKYNESVSEV